MIFLFSSSNFCHFLYSNAFTIQIGDIPDADIKPPDNVLFVCKLNPVTEVSEMFFPLLYMNYTVLMFMFVIPLNLIAMNR